MSDTKEETVVVETFCILCHTGDRVEVPRAGYEAWQAGEFIQNALPTLSADEREQLVSGSHGSCFDNAFPEDN